MTDADLPDDRRIAPLADVPREGSLLFTMRDGFDEVEAILVRLADGDPGSGTAPDDRPVAAWLNYCQHWTDVRLDKGSGAAERDGELVCQKHGAIFRKSDGECTFGPCEGAFLDPVDVTVHDGDVYLTDDDYEFDHLGPGEEVDLSSGSRIDFTGT